MMSILIGLGVLGLGIGAGTFVFALEVYREAGRWYDYQCGVR